ncbi:hypothetical protein [Micromonospora sp. NPDC002717]|uniref:hypothetical protein n=1 Tax=Micromonospora sp. NPDC002717 TaxID=3154424 RepID=UPI0033182F6F
MIMDDADATTVRFLRMMRATLREEKVGEDTLGRTVELARAWGTSEAADAQLRAALRRLHGESPDSGDPRQVADECVGLDPDGVPDPATAARGRAIGRFAANARRLREGEIGPAEFDRIVGEGREG